MLTFKYTVHVALIDDSSLGLLNLTLGGECQYTLFTYTDPTLLHVTLMSSHSNDHVVMFHCLYTDSEKHFKVVVVSETFEGMLLLKVSSLGLLNLTLGGGCQYTLFTYTDPTLLHVTLMSSHSNDHVVMFHCLYTDSEKHFKVVVESETFEGMPLLKVCRVQNHCLILRPRFQF